MKPYTLLLVDDHAVVREGIRNALSTLEQTEVIGEVGDGQALFAFLEHRVPDCLLIDITMPHFEPIADIRRIHQTYPEMKILVVSAYDDDVYVQGLLGIGVNGYHLKDQPLDDLRLAVQRVLAGERWVTSRLVDRLIRPSTTTETSIPQLTNRQRDILRLLHQGMDNRSIAQELQLSVKTVENHLTRLYRQIDVNSRLEAMNFIIQHPQILATHSDDFVPQMIAPSTTHRDKTILVVDDNQRFRQQLVKIIGQVTRDTTIYESANTAQAVTYAHQIQPRMAFVDMVLGDENGIQCLREIKKASPKTRVILISAYPDSEFHRQGIEAGALAFVDKKMLDAATLRQILQDSGIH